MWFNIDDQLEPPSELILILYMPVGETLSQSKLAEVDKILSISTYVAGATSVTEIVIESDTD